MQMLNLLKKSKKMKKSQALLIGSLLIFGGVVAFSWNYLLRMRDEVFSDMKIAMMDTTPSVDVQEDNPPDMAPQQYEEQYTIDYSRYFGVLEIPRIGLKRGFYNVGSRYNTIQYNVTLNSGSTMPTEGHGNVVLTAHSGDSYISYFAYLYRLNVGDDCYITYNGNVYHYQIVNIYNVPKSGVVMVDFEPEIMRLTLITCTKDSDTEQTIYIANYIG